MNQVNLVGRIVRPIEVKQVGENRVVNNTLAISRHHRDRNGMLQTDFIPFTAWGHLADLLQSYSEKGRRVAITGKMQSRSYTNHMNQQVYLLECVATEITLLERVRTKSYQSQDNTEDNMVVESEVVEAVLEKMT